MKNQIYFSIKNLFLWARSELIGFTDCFLLVHFLLVQKTNQKMTPVPLGPLDCLALLETAWILQTCFAQTVQNPLRHFLWCSASVNGKISKTSPLKGQPKRGPLGSDIYFFLITTETQLTLLNNNCDMLTL